MNFLMGLTGSLLIAATFLLVVLTGCSFEKPLAFEQPDNFYPRFELKEVCKCLQTKK